MVNIRNMYEEKSLIKKILLLCLLIGSVITSGLFVTGLVAPDSSNGRYSKSPLPFSKKGAPRPFYDVHHLQGIYKNGKTFIAYQGKNLDPYIVCYDHEKNTWKGPKKVGTNPMRYDGHGAPSMIIDSKNRIHVFYGCHGTPLFHSMTTKPLDIQSFISLSPITDKATYPQARILNGKIFLFYRAGLWNSGSDWVYRVSKTGLHWSQEHAVLDGKGPSGEEYYDWYACINKGNQRIQLAYGWADITEKEKMKGIYNLYYLSFDGNHWENVKGRTMDSMLPLDLRENNNYTLIKRSEQYTHPDPRSYQGRPIILARGKGKWTTYSWNGMEWNSEAISEFSQFGRGALDPYSDRLKAYIMTDEHLLEEWTWKGGEWKKTQTVYNWENSQNAMSSKSAVKSLHLVKNYREDAKLIFSPRPEKIHKKAYYDASNNSVYLWGEKGYLGKTKYSKRAWLMKLNFAPPLAFLGISLSLAIAAASVKKKM